jgi:outer membrane protein assembly factor BamB
MYRGDAQHTGRSPYLLPEQKPQERWSFPTSGIITAAPALSSDGTILFGSHDGFVYALSPQGSPRWRFRTADMVWATPALSPDGTIFVGSDDDRLYALLPGDGTPRWSRAPGSCKRSGGRSPEGARCDIEQVTRGPDGTLYVGGDGVYALGEGGTVRWHFDPASGATAEQPPPTAALKKVHCGSSPSLGRDGMVYAICQDMLYALGPDGSKRWEFMAQGEFEASPALEGGLLYLGSDDRRLYALDPSGQVRFSFLAAGPIRTAVALGRDGAVLFGCDEDTLYSLRGTDGTLLWSFRTAGAVRSSPLTDAAGNVVFGSRDDRLYAVAADGRLLWSVALEGDVDGSPALGPDGTIYVGADDRALHALR